MNEPEMHSTMKGLLMFGVKLDEGESLLASDVLRGIARWHKVHPAFVGSTVPKHAYWVRPGFEK